MADVAELGQKLKAKHPGAYDQMDDAEVGRRVKAKYPGAYDQFGDTAAAPAAQPFSILDTAKGVATGVAKEFGSTALNGYEILRKPGFLNPINTFAPLPMSAAKFAGLELPPPPAWMTEGVKAKTGAETVGKVLGGIAEFALPLSRISKAATGLPMLGRMAAEAAGGGGVAAIQSGGDPIATALGGVLGAAAAPIGSAVGAGVGVVKRAAAGAKEGGLGGAVARAVRGVIPQEARTTMIQALKPRLSKVNFDRSLDKALPELKAAESELGKPIENLVDLTEGLKVAKSRIWSQLESVMAPGRAVGKFIDLNPVANGIEGTITKTMRLENPAKVKAIEKLASKYRGKFKIEDAEDFLHETNAEAAPFYSKLPADQQRAIQSGANLSQLEAKASALRKAIDRGLDDLTQGSGAAAKELRRRYGSLMEVNEEAVRRVNVAKRLQPESLSEQIAGWSAAGDLVKGGFRMVRGMATGSPGSVVEGAADIVSGQAKRAAAKFIKEQQTTDALIRRAMRDVSTLPTPVVLPPPPRVAGLLESGPIRMPGIADPSGMTVTTGPPLQPRQPKIAGLLEASPTRLPAIPDPSGVRATSPREIIVKDPATGKLKKIFLSDWKGRGMELPPPPPH